MRFTDPNLFVHVRYNRVKDRPGKSLRVYQVVQANTNQKITALKSLGKVKGPAATELIFGDGSRVDGAHYQKLLGFLKERDLYVNCLGRMLVTYALHKGYYHPPPLAPEIDCLRVYDYFPWAEYGGPSLEIDKSWVALDLKQGKVSGQDEEEKLRDELAESVDEKAKLRQKYDDLEKKFEDLKAADLKTEKGKKKKEEKDEEPSPQTSRGRVPFGELLIESSSVPRVFNYIAFSSRQIACKDYGIFFTTNPRLQSEHSTNKFGVSSIKVFAYGESYTRPFNGSARLVFMVLYRATKGGNGSGTVAFLDANCSGTATVDTAIWRRTDGGTRVLEAKPGSIWGA